MTDNRWLRIEEIFQQAADLPPADRSQFLAEACAGDDGLRREVESLLAHDQSQNDVLVAAISEAVGEPSESRPIPDLVGKQFGPYHIVSLLGRGGMGTVYKARDPRLGRDIAIMVLNEKTSAVVDGRARFEREARAAGALNHPNILAVYDFGLDNGSTSRASWWRASRFATACGGDRSRFANCTASPCNSQTGWRRRTQRALSTAT